MAFGAVDFDGTDDYIALTDGVFDSLTQGTISAWIKWNGTTTGAIIDQGDCQTDDGQFEFYISSGAIGVWAVNDAASCNASVDASVSISDPTDWHHVVYTNDTSGHKVYVDGVEQVLTYNTGNSSTDFFFDNPQSGEPYRIGGVMMVASESFPGLIDDVRIYNRVLTATEIEIIAKGRLKYDSLTTPGNGLVGYWPLDDSPDGTSGDGDTFVDRSGTGNNGTGVDGANNTGLTARASSYLMYPAPVR